MAKGTRKPATKAKAKTASKPKPTPRKVVRPPGKSKAAKKPAKATVKAKPARSAPAAKSKAAPKAAPRPKAAPALQPREATPKTALRPPGRVVPAEAFPEREERDTSVSAAFPPVGVRLKSKMPHIDDETLGKIIAKLEEMRAESQAVVNQHVATDLSAKEQGTDVGDELDQAGTERDREFNLIMHQRHLRRLQQIQEAFQRIEEGTYGYCEGTDEPINPRRLVIMPLARYSLEYQEQQEKMLGRSPEDTYTPAEEEFTVEE
jgi:DnaK suppressor protein